MGRYAVIIVMTLVFLIGFFVISNNRLKEDSLLQAIEINEYNHAKNVANSALQIGIRKIIDTDWEVMDNETWHLDNNNWVKATNPNNFVFNPWTDIDGFFALSAIRQANTITLTSIGRYEGNSDKQYTARASLKFEDGGDEEEFEWPDFDGIFARSSAQFDSPVQGVVGTNSSTAGSIQFGGGPHGRINGKLYYGPGGNHSNITSNSSRVTGGLEELNETIDFPYPPHPPFPSLQNRVGSPISETGFYGSVNNVTIDTGNEGNVIHVSFDTVGDITLTGSGKAIVYVENSIINNSKIGSNTEDIQNLMVYYYGSNDLGFHGNARMYGVLYLTNENAELDIIGNPVITGLFISKGPLVRVGGTSRAMSIYAPDANVEIFGTSSLEGSVIANRIETWGTPSNKITYNSNWKDDLPEFQGPGSGGGHIVHRFTY